MVTTLDGFEYRYVAISEEEFLKVWQVDGFFAIGNPLSFLAFTEAGSFEEIDRGEIQVTNTTEP